MTYGKSKILECPNCKTQYEEMVMASGNTIGATLWSDGYLEAPMLFYAQMLVKCLNCDIIFWTEDAAEVGEKEPMGEEFTNARAIPDLTLDVLQEAIELEPQDNLERLTYLRVKMWHTFNDRVREGESLWQALADVKIMADNCKGLLQLLQQQKDADLLMIAELYRHLGNFDKALETLSKVTDPNQQVFKDVLISQCEAQNRVVVRLC